MKPAHRKQAALSKRARTWTIWAYIHPDDLRLVVLTHSHTKAEANIVAKFNHARAFQLRCTKVRRKKGQR